MESVNQIETFETLDKNTYLPSTLQVQYQNAVSRNNILPTDGAAYIVTLSSKPIVLRSKGNDGGEEELCIIRKIKLKRRFSWIWYIVLKNK